MERFGPRGEIWGGEAMRGLFERLRVAAHGHGVLLLRGEHGSGRRTLARAIHELSRPGKHFTVVDLAAIPPELRESTLFGHESSTFLGGSSSKRGAFESVEDGTIVLREIAAIPDELQAKIVRLIERRQYQRVGAYDSRPFHGRVIATTHCDLEELVAERLFRGELLEAITSDGDLRVPPLRDRIADLPGLLSPVLAAVGAPPFETAQLARLAVLPWRGNLDQLEAFARGLSRRPSIDGAITELELLEAIAGDPDDDALRMVYGDLLSSHGDPRGELIGVQCRLAGPDAAQASSWRAAEQRLLARHRAAWDARVSEIAGSPTTTTEVSYERGFVDRIVTTDDVCARLDRVFRVAPLLRRFAWYGRNRRQHWVSPLLRRIRELEVQVASLDEPEVVALARHPYFDQLRALGLHAMDAGVSETDPVIGESHLQLLATSLPSLDQLAITNHRLDARMTAALTAETCAWQLSELSLVDCALDDAAVLALLAGPKAKSLRAVDLRLNPLGAAAREALAQLGPAARF